MAPSTVLASAAFEQTSAAYRPSTIASHELHCRTYFSFLLFMDLPPAFTLHSLLAFLEYLYVNHLSPKVIQNYLSSLKTFAKVHSLSLAPFSHQLISAYVRSISINSQFSPLPKGIFDLNTLTLMIRACDLLDDPPLYKTAFLLAFYGFLRMSNIAPHSKAKFNPDRHILRQDIIFAPPPPPGAHVLLKWTKTLQESRSHPTGLSSLMPSFSLENPFSYPTPPSPSPSVCS